MTHLRFPLLVLVLALGCGTVPVLAGTSIEGSASARDGDSLEIGAVRVRLWGVDAPEYRQTCLREGRRWACGEAAQDALQRRIARHRVACEILDIDRYGRRLARCTVQGHSLNEWLVREGWALDYTRYSGGRYAAAQREARSARRGIWSGEFQQPERFRRAHPRAPARGRDRP